LLDDFLPLLFIHHCRAASAALPLLLVFLLARPDNLLVGCRHPG
jgi:hypothetical protein